MTLAAPSAGQKPAPSPPGENAPAPQPSALLAWYDRNRRRLPWRAEPGEATDPYRVWLSEIMLQQTTVKTVIPYYARFLSLWPDVHALAAASQDDVLRAWAGLGYYARARHLHACAKTVSERFGGRFPAREDELRKLPGIGAYTAAAIAAIAFEQPVVPLDGNVERVAARLFALEEALPGARPVLRARVGALAPPIRRGDFAQALMDLGATLCTPRKPACGLCPWQGACAAFAGGSPESFPRKARKPARPLRRGAAFVVLRAGCEILVRRRPPRGLLGGMMEVPTTAWRADFTEAEALVAAPAPPNTATPWRRLPGVVTHMFTHFPLELTVYRADVPEGTGAPPGMRWIALDTIDGEALPSLMRKVVAHARAAAAPDADLAAWQFTFAGGRA
ncbi:MAG TPA: A/G-specific adenine glycosylase [Xanthobacteraceae bacterium]|nr:A/G-specific adenine glycosylase [Xanthobacteraceae bacterium]